MSSNDKDEILKAATDMQHETSEATEHATGELKRPEEEAAQSVSETTDHVVDKGKGKE